MANTESLILDGLSLNDPSGAYIFLGEIDYAPPQKRYGWLPGSDADGDLLMRDPLFGNRTVTVTLRVMPQASMDVALAQIGAIVDKLEEAERQENGLAMVWTPAGSAKSVTVYVLSGEITGIPVGQASSKGWFRFYPQLTLRLDCKPFLYGPEMNTFTDPFSSNTIANYTVDAGAAGNVSITGGVMTSAANPATENRFIQTNTAVAPYSVGDAQATLKHTVGTTLTSYKAGVILKRIDANNYLEAYVTDSGAASTLKLDVIIGGSRTNRASIALTRITISTAFWIRARVEGNNVFLEHWTSAPTQTGTPAAGSVTTSQYTLASGSEQNTLGQTILARQGIVWAPQQAAATLDDFQVDPYHYASSQPMVLAVIPRFPGDVRGELRIIVMDGGAAGTGQSRRYVEWGIQNRYTDLATKLLLQNTDLTITGFAGASTTRAGSFSTNIFRGTLTTSPTAICGTGNSQAHIGVFRVRARVYAAPASGIPSDIKFRWTWQDGSGPFRSNPYTNAPVANTWCDVDLGLVTISQAKLGTQQWTGQLQVYSAAAGDTLDVDYVMLIPALEGYGKARAIYSYSAGATVGYDAFTAITAGTALNARTAPLGGVWATSGAVTDFTAADAPLGTDETETRATASDGGGVGSGGRFAILGSTNYTDCEVGVDMYTTSLAGAGSFIQGVVARWVDASNFLNAYLIGDIFSLAIWNGSTVNLLGTAGTVGHTTNRWYRIRLIVYATGRAVAQLIDASSGGVMATIDKQSSILATGGTLATGKPGFKDWNNGLACTRYYDNFYAATPSIEPIGLYATRQLEFRSDSTIRQDSTGTFWGPAPGYLGDRPYLPCAGGPNRTTRVLVKADRNDLEAAEDVPLSDILRVQVVGTPRYIAVPR